MEWTTVLDDEKPVCNLLLSLVRSSLAHIGHDLRRVLRDLVVVTSRNGSLVKQGSNETNRSGSVLQEFAGVVQVDSRSRVDGEEGKGRTDSLDPVGSSGDSREELLQRSSAAVSVDELGRRLASRNTDNVAVLAPLNHIRKHNRSDDELTSRIDGGRRVVGCENGSTANHDIAVVLRTEVSQVAQAVGSRQRELANLETSVDGSLHGLGAGLRGGRTEDGTSTNLGEGIQDTLVVVDALHAIKTCCGSGEGTGRNGLSEGKSEGHGGRLFAELDRCQGTMRKVVGVQRASSVCPTKGRLRQRLSAKIGASLTCK